MSSELSLDKNPISRLRHKFLQAIKENIVFLKIVVIVPDDDILKCLPYDEKFQQNAAKLVDWLMRKFYKAVEIQRDFLLAKSKKSAYPTFVWIEAPSHMNFPPDNQAMRKLYNSAVNAVAQRYEDTYSLQLKKVWDPHASSLFMVEDLRYTAEGLRTYWEAVDKTVRYVDTLLLKKPVKKQNPATEAPAQHPINERNRAIGPSWEF